MDLSQTILEEIALDGLDGVTLESLWYHLNSTKPKFQLVLDDNSKSFLWTNVISRLKDVSLFIFYLTPITSVPLIRILFNNRQ